MSRPSFRTLLKYAVTLSLLILLATRIDWPAFAERVAGADPLWLALYASILFGGVLLSAGKWRFIARESGFPITFSWSLRTYLVGMFANNFLPSFVGGDAYRAYALGRPTARVAEAAAGVFFDRLTGLSATVFLSLVFAPFAWGHILASPVWLVVEAALCLFAGAHLFFRAWPRLFSLAGQRFGEKIGRFNGMFAELATRPFSFFATAVSWGTAFNFFGVGVANLALFRALDIAAEPLPYFAAVFVISIVSSIPITINNWGLKEGAYFVFFGAIGMDPTAAVAASLIGRMVQTGVSVLGLPWYLAAKENLPKEQSPASGN